MIGIGAVTLWTHRSAFAQYALTVVFSVTVVWSYVLLDRTPTWHPWLRASLAIGGFLVLAAMLFWHVLGRRVAAAVAAGAVVVALLGPGAYTLATAATPHAGAIPSAGPTVAGSFGPGGRGPGAFGRGGFPRGAFRQGGFGPGGFLPGGAPRGGFNPGGAAPGGFGGLGGFGGPPGGGRGGGGPGGFLSRNDRQRGHEVAARDREHRLPLGCRDRRRQQRGELSTRHAASPSWRSAASTGPIPHRPLRSSNRTSPPTRSTTSSRAAAPQAAGRVAASGSTAREIASWVANNFPATTVGGVTVYDLTRARSVKERRIGVERLGGLEAVDAVVADVRHGP